MLPCQPGGQERLGTGAASQALSSGAAQRATMACGAEARAAMVTGAISGWLKRQFPTHEDMQISHEAIYRSLFVQTRGVLKKELTVHLRTRRRMRLPKRQNVEVDRDILDGLDPRAAGRGRGSCRAGHWEGDLLTGGNDTHIATLIERHSRFTMLVKLPRKDTTTVVAALAKHVRKLPEELRRSLTWDQGKEMHAHSFIRAWEASALRSPLQRAGLLRDPRSPWQRGSNE